MYYQDMFTPVPKKNVLNTSCNGLSKNESKGVCLVHVCASPASDLFQKMSPKGFVWYMCVPVLHQTCFKK